jgi:D-alanyl-D-alanine carboxypeptidase (penicillin-binding protein 5/6)
MTSMQRAELRRRRRSVVRHRQLIALASLVALVVALVEIVSPGGAHLAGAARGGKSATGAVAPPPPTAAQLVVGPTRTATVPGGHPAITWPTTGQAAVGVQGMGVMAASAHERSMPIASMTKMMTALIVVHDHPLAPGQSGPVLTMNAADVATWVHDSESDDSSVAVKRGEKLSELQLLEALLIPSGDNIARTLAVWDAGSQAAFVAKMNATARAMGLRNTHYGDPAGLSPLSRSTAADQVVVAEAVMAVPALRFVVAQSHVAFPVAGTIWNFNPALDVDGIVGVKSGFTNAAQACLATAVWRVVAGRKLLVVAVSMHQPDGLSEAAQVDEQLLASAGATIRPYTVLAPSAPVAQVVVPWSKQRLEAVGPATSVQVPAWAGLQLDEQVVAGPPLHPLVPAGAYAGRLEVSAAGEELVSVVLRLSAGVPSLSGKPAPVGTTGGHGAPGHGAPGHVAPGHVAPGHGAPGHGAPGHGAPATTTPRAGSPSGSVPASTSPSGSVPASTSPASAGSS